MTAGVKPKGSRGSRIIERPRLMRLLDETDAKTILLIAPAGYGKTTLARQWAATLSGPTSLTITRRHRDVAWLAQDLVGSIVGVTSAAIRAINEQVNAQRNPQLGAGRLGAEIARQLDELGTQWLILDDYHEIGSVDAAEELVDAIASRCRARLLIASRTRPAWATSRRSMYGELLEINRESLAMDESETAFLLADAPAAEGIARQAAGWPAALALAATAKAARIPENVLPEALHRYLVEELYSRAAPDLRRILLELALSGDLSARDVDARIGLGASAALEAAQELGFMTGAHFELHPLLREFLLEKLADEPDADARIRRAIEDHLREARWDEALELIQRFRVTELTDEAITVGFKPLTLGGRLETLALFATAIARAPAYPPASIDVVLAEAAFRNGDLELARDLAETAHRRLASDHPLVSRGLLISGQVAFQIADYTGAKSAFAAALASAMDDRDRADALHGAALADIFGESANAGASLRALAKYRDRTPVDLLRFLVVEYAFKRLGGDESGLSGPMHLGAGRRAFDRVDDPRVRTAFAYSVAAALAQRADYATADEWIRLVLADAERFGLDLVLPFANWVRGHVALGLRRVGEAERALQAVEDIAKRSGDHHHVFNARSLRARLMIQTRDFEGAAELLAHEPEVALAPSWRGESLAMKAIAYACLGATDDALTTASQADEVTIAVEVRVLAQLARALLEDKGESTATRDLMYLARTSSVWDPVVLGLRASPELPARVAADPDLRPLLADLLERTKDVAVARRTQIRTRAVAPPTDLLSPREIEVLELIANGYRNREISKALFIADSTTKVHVRHIFEKLGVRTRSAAVARWRMFDESS